MESGSSNFKYSLNRALKAFVNLFSKAGNVNLAEQLIEVTKRQWYIGFISFGGPVVQFSNFNKIFVQKYHWLDDREYQELFGVAQSLPGSASTKMLFIITLLRTSILPALLSFLFWALPGAIGMLILAVGISQVGTTLPIPVYSLLSGLNSAIVGVILLAAIDVSKRAVTDKLSYLLIFLGGAFGIMYTALWYFPVLMISSGIITLIYDSPYTKRLLRLISVVASTVYHKYKTSPPAQTEESIELEQINSSAMERQSELLHDVPTKRAEDSIVSSNEVVIETMEGTTAVAQGSGSNYREQSLTRERSIESEPHYPILLGICVVLFFIVSFVIVMVIRSVVKNAPVTYMLFSNMYLAGTIIFGGGPVVIPLLREYTVGEGWVSSRDFAIGLALIQAFPGPNFNFAIYLGALTYHNNGSSLILGAIVSFLGMYAPGMLIASGMFTFWHKLRKIPVIVSILRGITSSATGLLWCAIYRIWESGFLSKENQSGVSLSNDPWWYVTSGTAFVMSQLYSIPAPISIAIGGAMGIIRWAYLGGEM
ncbi:chromate transporter-domain-containing protein [Dipodascopsis uninucleata]